MSSCTPRCLGGQLGLGSSVWLAFATLLGRKEDRKGPNERKKVNNCRLLVGKVVISRIRCLCRVVTQILRDSEYKSIFILMLEGLC